MRRQRRYRKKRLVRSKRLKKAIRAVARSTQELKKNIYVTINDQFNQYLSTTGDCLRLLPQIYNGTPDGYRVGTRIHLGSIHVRGVMTFLLPIVGIRYARVGVRLLVLRKKGQKDWAQAANSFPSDYVRLLEAPQGSSGAFQGTLADFNKPVNTDFFSVKKDLRFFMSKSDNPGSPLQTQDTITCTKFVNFKLKGPKQLCYDDSYSLADPVNFPYFMLLSYVFLDGTAPDNTTSTLLTFQYTSKVTYRDA